MFVHITMDDEPEYNCLWTHANLSVIVDLAGRADDTPKLVKCCTN